MRRVKIYLFIIIFFVRFINVLTFYIQDLVHQNIHEKLEQLENEEIELTSSNVRYFYYFHLFFTILNCNLQFFFSFIHITYIL
jgi:hypothetical protein